MNKEKIAKIVSQVRSKKSSNKIKENIEKESALKLANILLSIEKCIEDLDN